jgi:hypothetical protein
MGANLLEATPSKTFCALLLGRMEMWCLRHWAEAQEAANAALAAGAPETHAYWRREQAEWLRAGRVIVELYRNLIGESANGKHT